MTTLQRVEVALDDGGGRFLVHGEASPQKQMVPAILAELVSTRPSQEYGAGMVTFIDDEGQACPGVLFIN